MKKISVIVPVWNVEKYLRKCLDSLVNQTLKDIEIILVNDESPDNSIDILKEYKNKDERIILIEQKNGGQGNARNNGINHASGEYISFVDSDDYIELDMFEKMYKLAKKEKADMCVCAQKKVNEKNEIIGYDYLNIAGEFGTCKTNSNIMFVNMGPCNKIFKRTLLESNEIRFPTNRLLWYEDLPFVAKCLLNSKKICWIDTPFYNYLQRENSTMNNKNIEKNTDIITSFDILRTYATDKKMDEYQKELEFLCIDHVYIATSVRVLKMPNKMKDKKIIINKLKEYLINNYPNYKQNNYINTLPKKRKLVYYLLNKNFYYIITFLFFIKSKFKGE